MFSFFSETLASCWTCPRSVIIFVGIISRSRADELLQNRPSGSFLVRVSERIWGYTISYVVGDGKVKHFLIERIPQGYQFLGTNQIVHKHLHDLVAYHEVSFTASFCVESRLQQKKQTKQASDIQIRD